MQTRCVDCGNSVGAKAQTLVLTLYTSSRAPRVPLGPDLRHCLLCPALRELSVLLLGTVEFMLLLNEG